MPIGLNLAWETGEMRPNDVQNRATEVLQASPRVPGASWLVPGCLPRVDQMIQSLPGGLIICSTAQDGGLP